MRGCWFELCGAEFALQLAVGHAGRGSAEDVVSDLLGHPQDECHVAEHVLSGAVLAGDGGLGAGFDGVVESLHYKHPCGR